MVIVLPCLSLSPGGRCSPRLLVLVRAIRFLAQEWDPYKGPRPIAVLIQTDPWLMAKRHCNVAPTTLDLPATKACLSRGDVEFSSTIYRLAISDSGQQSNILSNPGEYRRVGADTAAPAPASA